jgi:Cu(I)/Ag(I) efflux system membrane protein CusA/SilA
VDVPPAVARTGVSTVTVGTYYPEERHPISRVLFAVYEPVCRFVLRFRKTTVAVALALVAATVPVYLHLGREFMPPLDEGDLLYMPVTLPGVSVAEIEALLRVMDRTLKDTPEVVRVFGKAGRAETSTDPAPLSMVEAVVQLKPRSLWRPGLTREGLEAELNGKLRFPGVTNAFVMPIRNRIDMLATGIRTPVGVKIYGADLRTIEEIGASVEAEVRTVRGARSVFAERTAEGYFLDIVWDREALARYGISMKDAQMIVSAAIGGEPVTTTVEGRERYGVSVRYPRELRDDPAAIARVLVTSSTGAQVPLSQVAAIRRTEGPSMIRDENGQLAGYVFIDVAGRDLGGFVEEAKRRVASSVTLPPVTRCSGADSTRTCST